MSRPIGKGNRSYWEIFQEDVATELFDELDMAELDELSYDELFQKFLETSHCSKLFEEWMQDLSDQNYERNFGDDRT